MPPACPHINQADQYIRYVIDCIGADTKSRTRDLLITNQLLYQLSYAGAGIIIETGKRGSKLVKALQKAIGGLLDDLKATLFTRKG